jgi:hypothetical protein
VPDPGGTGDRGDDPAVQGAPERLGRGRITILLRREEGRVEVDGQLGDDDRRSLPLELASEGRNLHRRHVEPRCFVAERKDRVPEGVQRRDDTAERDQERDQRDEVEVQDGDC